ncbi:MAG: tRNA (adenosine(37)-N6)-threonylcarbamoyltransferase complex ATPase subunit type 1 TsaE [Helicobacteraceae bacterium]|nr:tRNA (adenosine(37)-N6)-threonylcarbamoyltransferase complex ATPase subunit type 1 TsaE [Helicobacteraceae bacterium]
MNSVVLNDISIQDLNLVCKEIESRICGKNHIVFLLQGDIGAGKTTLIKQYAKFINLNDMVTSPTFSLLHQYGDNFFHYDLYNRKLKDLLEIGILDLLGKDGIHFVEWGSDELGNIIKDAYENIFFIQITKTHNRNYKFI